MALRKTHLGLLATWIVIMVLGMAGLIAYQYRPGDPGNPALQWPEQETVSLWRDAGCFTLVIAIHPRCSCSRATLNELAHIQRYTARTMKTYLLFNVPTGQDDSWAETDLWGLSEGMVNTERIVDRNGTLCDRFGAATSGFGMLYSDNGELLFAGGITGSRAHEGDNYGRQAVIARVMGGEQHLPSGRAPVFGCSIDSTETAFK